VLTALLLLALSAFVVTILAALNRAPLYVAVLVLTVIELLRALPLGR
jgi:hypothetical protein